MEHYTALVTCVGCSPRHGGWELRVEGVSMLLGAWWLAAAARGKLASLPLTNTEPVMITRQEEEQQDCVETQLLR